MGREHRFDSLIQYWAQELGAPWLWIWAMAGVESDYDPKAVSPVGARGLMQVMSGTWHDMGGTGRPDDDLEGSVRIGIAYWLEQYRHFPEIPDTRERMRFATASYNCGRGYVNAALRVARKTADPGWQKWSAIVAYLPGVRVRGRHPDAKQTVEYVRRVEERFEARCLEDLRDDP